jgi:HlyD family secretion protein
MKNRDLFRQAALDQLSSPDQLDSLLQVTTPRGWIALAGVGVLILTALGWSVIGRLPTKLVGQQCILLMNGGVNILAASASGRLSDLAVESGDTVTRGQIIGRLEQYDLLQKVKAGEARVTEVQLQYEHALAIAAQGAALRAESSAQQRRNLSGQLAAAERKYKLLKERTDTQGALLDEGLIAKPTLITSQLDLAAAQLEIDNIRSQFKQLDLNRMDANKQSDADVTQAKGRLEEARRQLALLLRDTRNFASVVSPYTGRVLEVKAVEGQLVERGTQLVSVESTGVDVNELEAYVYLPTDEGKKVAPGMKVEISPSTARREEFGFMPAFVSAVADYPSTDQGLMRVLGNDKLVQHLSGTAAPIQVVASLASSATNASHYQWSTRTGPPFALQSGTACTASITLSEQWPIGLLIPALRKTFGLH